MRGRHLAPSVRRIARGWVVPLALSFSLVMGSIAFASSVDVAVVDVTVPVGSVTLAPGASEAIMVRATVSGAQIGTATFRVYRDWTLTGGVFTGSNPETFTAGPQAGGATQVFEVAGTVTVASGQAAGTFILGASAFDITNSNTTGAKLTDGADSSYSVTVLAPPADTTPPVIVPTVTGTLGSNGWYISDVALSWAVTDAESTVTSTSGCGGVSLTTDTAGITYTCTATSTGGTASQSVTIKRDATAPSVSGSASPAANGAGWSNSDVTVSFSCSDALSGVASCGPNSTLSDEGAGQSVTGSAVDNAGNSASTTVSNINIDKTAPTITGSRSPTANAAGWNNTDVTVTFSCSDALSGVASCTGPEIVGEGAGQSRTGTAVDDAGNSASATVSGINVDKTAPTAAVTGVAHGATYTLGAVPAGGCRTADALSGVATEAAYSLSGGPLVGMFTATCSGAVDMAGNLGTRTSITYTVIYNWSGFFQPIDNPGWAMPYAFNRVKAGSAVPVKFSLSGYQGMNIFESGYPSATSTSCTAAGTMDTVETTLTASNSGLSYDASVDQYVYVWKTDKSWAGSCRKLTVRLIDGTDHVAYFNFTR